MITNDIGMNQNCVSSIVSHHEGTACLAFQLWEKAGCPNGRDLEFWLGAEAHMLADRKHGAGKVGSGAAKASSTKPLLF
jgi:hypothetical protein